MIECYYLTFPRCAADNDELCVDMAEVKTTVDRCKVLYGSDVEWDVEHMKIESLDDLRSFMYRLQER